HLTFPSSGAVTVSEDSVTSLTGTSTANSLLFPYTTLFRSTNSASLAVTSNASLSGTSITLGAATSDTMNFGTLTFTSSGAVTVSEGNDTRLNASHSANTHAVVCTRTNSDTNSASLAVTSNA